MLCSEKRPCADVLARPHKESLKSALTTKDVSTNKDSIVTRLQKHHPKKEKSIGTRTVGQDTSPVDNMVSHNTPLKWYLPF